MPDLGIEVRKNNAGLLARLLPGLIADGVRLQTLETTRRVEYHIVATKSVRTGRMLASVRGRMLGPKLGVVTVEAKSDRGFPYPLANNNGWHDRSGRYHAGRHWAEKAAAEAEQTYAVTMRKQIERAV